MSVRRQESIGMKADSEVTKVNKVQREYSIQPMAHPVRDSVGRWQVVAKSSPLLAILSKPHNLNTSENLSILNLLAQLVLPIILLYSAHPPPLLFKYLIVHTTEPLQSSGIIYQNLWELSLARHLMLQPLVNLTRYHSHFLRLNFAHISKHTFSASRTHLKILSCSDWLHRSLP